MFVYLLKMKWNVVQKIKEFKALVENETSKKIYTIQQTHNGGEYCSNILDSFCKNNGVSIETSTTYTSQENFISKR